MLYKRKNKKSTTSSSSDSEFDSLDGEVSNKKKKIDKPQALKLEKVWKKSIFNIKKTIFLMKQFSLKLNNDTSVL